MPLWQLLAPSTLRPPRQREEEQYPRVITAARMYDDPAVWRSFLRHARYIRQIEDAFWATSSVDTPLLILVLKHNGGCTVFPSLRHLHWDFPVVSDDSLFTILSSLSTLTLWSSYSGHVHEDRIKGLLRYLQDNTPHMNTIRLFDIRGRFDSQFLRALGQHPSLRVLEVTNSVEELTYLALVMMPNIIRLAVAVHTMEPGPSSRPRFSLGPALRELSLLGSERQLTNALSGMQGASLRTLRLQFLGTSHLEATGACLAAGAAALTSSSDARELHIEGSGLEWETLPETQPYPMLAAFLRPLFPLGALDHLTVSFPRARFGATDEEMLEIGQALRGVHAELRVDVCWAACEHEGPVPTEDGWARFMQLCPRFAGLECPPQDRQCAHRS
ncbi:hypothetical protein BD413DRAFT_490896 [Trametes elegans]|nr:hypothetical protein BD413DRAFT_490896 [Trametes elegans]